MSDLQLNSRTSIPEEELRLTFVRSSGPGGQNVNKVNTKAALRWAATRNESLPEAWRNRFLAEFAHRITNSGDIILTCDRHRDQTQNREAALARLRAMLLSVARPPKRRKPTKPSRAAKQRRLDEKKRRGETKRQRRDPRLE